LIRKRRRARGGRAVAVSASFATIRVGCNADRKPTSGLWGLSEHNDATIFACYRRARERAGAVPVTRSLGHVHCSASERLAYCSAQLHVPQRTSARSLHGVGKWAQRLAANELVPVVDALLSDGHEPSRQAGMGQLQLRIGVAAPRPACPPILSTPRRRGAPRGRCDPLPAIAVLAARRSG
jgi:hypothetical protein